MGRSRNGQAVPELLRTEEAMERLVAFQADARATNDMKRWFRATAIIDYVAGRSVVDIAASLHIGESSVWDWIGWYRREGLSGLYTAKTPGSKSRLTEEQRRELSEWVVAGPLAAGFHSGMWTCAMVAELIQSRFGYGYHPQSVARLLHEIGFSVQRPRKRLARADPASQTSWIQDRLPDIKKKLTTTAE